jgi:hypothetical protein
MVFLGNSSSACDETQGNEFVTMTENLFKVAKFFKPN